MRSALLAGFGRAAVARLLDPWEPAAADDVDFDGKV